MEIKAIAEAVHSWGGRFDAVRFEAKHGAVPDAFASDYYYSWAYGEKKRQSVLPLFFYQGEIPEELRPRLAEMVPAPAAMKVVTLSDGELPASIAGKGGGAAETLRRAETEALVRHDLPAVLRLIGQRGITVGATTGLPGSAAVAKLEAVLLGGDWYSAEDDRCSTAAITSR